MRLTITALVAAAWTSLAPAAALAQTPAAAERPNILLIQADDLGYGDLSAYGQGQFQTPALDRLAREGIRFTQYYSGSTVCAPSRAALMTGQHTGHAWIRGNGEIPLRAEDATVAMLLRDAGYRTAVIGKWGLGGPGTTGAARQEGLRLLVRLSRSSARAPAVHRPSLSQRRAGRDGPRSATTSTICSRKETAAFIARDDARPFFVYLNYTVPHAELRAARGFDGAAPREVSRRRRSSTRRRTHGRPARRSRVPSLGYRSQPAPQAAFAAMIQRMDRDIGRAARPACGAQASIAGHADHLHQRQRPASRGRRRPGVLQELGRPARHQARPLRRRHPRADDRALDRARSRRAASAITSGRTGTSCRR